MLRIYRLLQTNILGRHFIDLLTVVRLRYYLLVMRRSQKNLVHDAQRRNYFLIRGEFQQKYSYIKNVLDSIPLTSAWTDYSVILEKDMLPYPRFSFLQNKTMMKSMFATGRDGWLDNAISDMERYFSASVLKKLLHEDYIGEPLIYSEKYMASHNSIEHTYHIYRFMDYIKPNTQAIHSVIEWGGGYGSMAKLFCRFYRNVKPFTYIIVDIPIVSCLQWLYLAVIFGEENVYCFQKPTDAVQVGKINIIPVSWAMQMNVRADIFISTWALSESPMSLQDEVLQRNWFDATHLLLAYRKNDERFPDSEHIGEAARKSGAWITRIRYISGMHYYAFR